MAGHGQAVRENVENTTCHGVGGLCIDIVEEHDILVPAGASYDALTTHQFDDALCCLVQQPVAKGVPEAVVDRLEVVEVDDQQGERHLPAHDKTVDMLTHAEAVEQPRQFIMCRLMDYLRLFALEFGDVEKGATMPETCP